MLVQAAAVDRFGYTLPNLTKEEAAARSGMISSEAIKARNWTSADISAFSPNRLKQLVREGVPANLRPEIWLQLSGGAALCAAHSPGHFAGLIAKSAQKALAMNVETALLRHMPSHKLLASSFGLQSVVKVVRAIQEHTQRSLQQNTTCIAAFLVSIMGLGREEDCFWIMIGLLGNVLPTGAVQGTSVELSILQELAERRCPKLCSAVEVLDSSLQEVACPWFSHLFCTALPAETAVRVWDCLLSEGPKVLFRVALALLKREEGVIAGNLQKFRNLQWRISRTYNADALLKVAFKGIGSLSMSEITRARRSVEASVMHGKTQQVKRLEALLCPPRISPQPSTSAISELSTITEAPENCATQHSLSNSSSADLSAFQQRLSPLKI